ncbi:MAG: putative conserved protein RhaS [Verrucomicrobia bacterium]|nr:MAG: putative conserved protein RhaS [Verrucomicrobiota bacterium]
MERKVTRGVDQPEVEGYQWDGWKLIMIAKLNTNGTFHSRKWSCVWRPDVGSSLYARSDWMRAGGVVGVAWLQTGAVQSYSYGTGGAEVHVPLADHMGNVRHYYQFKSTKGNVTGQLVASYEYDAFGREVRAWGLNTPTENQPPGLPASRPWADLLPFHYSSKLRDVDSGFNYYGYRFYDPGAGRWLNRDPIGEAGGVNLYGMVGNDAVNDFDIDGLSPRTGRPPRGGPVANAQALEAANIGQAITRSYLEKVIDVFRRDTNSCCPKTQRDQMIREMKRIIGPTIGPPATASSVREHTQWMRTEFAKVQSQMIEAECRALHQAARAQYKGSGIETNGVRPAPGTRVRPLGLPETWDITGTDKPGGVQYTNPAKPNENVRVMQGEPGSKYPNSQAPYVRQQNAAGTYLRQDGTPSTLPGGGRKDDDAHIPLNKFIFRIQ